MSTYLLAWNPKLFPWDDLEECIRKLRRVGHCEERWSCGQSRNIRKGCRFFMIRVGREPRGLVGAGTVSSAPLEEPHWDEGKAAKGHKALFCGIRFDSLSRIPYIRRMELNHPPFDKMHWDTQSSGVQIPDDIAEELELLWKKRLSLDHPHALQLPEELLDQWREISQQATEDTEWTERHVIRGQRRHQVLPEMRSLIESFLAERISTESFRSTLDQKTRNEWDLFGLKGMSGAMFLNMLVKHLPDQDELEVRLREVLARPQDEVDARSKLDEFEAYLRGQIVEGTATGSQVQPNRIPFLVSAAWHLQEPEDWPIFYRSARKTFQQQGLLGGDVKGSDGYLEFRRIYRAIESRLGLDLWQLEHLCTRVQSRPAPLDEDEEDRTVGDETTSDSRVWLFSPGKRASQWDAFYKEGIVAIGWDFLGDLNQYPDLEAYRQAIQAHKGIDHNPFQSTLMCYQFAHEMEVGDVVFAKRGFHEIIGYGIVTSEYRHEPNRKKFTNVRKVDWKKRGKWRPRKRPMVTKTLTNIGKYPALVSQIRQALDIEAEDSSDGNGDVITPATYDIEDAKRDLFLAEKSIEEALSLLRYKKNLVLQGPPGVGKTFFAKRLAYLLLGEKNPKRLEQVQFHQSYSYEDFVQGYRPDEGGSFARVDGPFYRFCDQALQDIESPYVLLIDEINRGNLSKILGELLLLIEADKRTETWASRLTYSREDEPRFYVPENLFIIGTMNTADRSLAMIDYALRRRFAFVDVPAAFESPALSRHLKSIGVSDALRSRINSRFQTLNEHIRQDNNLRDGFCIGHSYFCRAADGEVPDDAWYERIVHTEIEPLLKEYWFDNSDKASEEIAQLLDED